MVRGPRKAVLVVVAISLIGCVVICMDPYRVNHLDARLPRQVLHQVERSTTDIVPTTTDEMLSESASGKHTIQACRTSPAPKCQTKKNKGDCKFPFKHKGKWYEVCTDKGHSALWCKTARGWGDCQSQARCTTAPDIADQDVFDQMVRHARDHGYCEETMNDGCSVPEIEGWASHEGKGLSGDEGKWASYLVSGFTSCSEAEAVEAALQAANSQYGMVGGYGHAQTKGRRRR